MVKLGLCYSKLKNLMKLSGFPCEKTFSEIRVNFFANRHPAENCNSIQKLDVSKALTDHVGPF